MNKKGQALVEFVLILPIFMMILFMIIDFGIIFTSKIDLENKIESVIIDIESKNTIDTIQEKYKEFDINISNYKNNYLKITLNKEINIKTPGLDKILGNPYKISTERVINYGFE